MGSFIQVYGQKKGNTAEKYPGLTTTVDGTVDESVDLGDQAIDIEGRLAKEPQLVPSIGQDTVVQPETIAFKDVTPAPIVESSAKTATAAEKQVVLTQEALDKARKQDKLSAAARATAGILRATGGVINANAKYQQTAGNNNFAIQQAQQQALMVASDVQQKILKEQTKGKARGESAMISAVAQGQAAGGDLAQTAISNEALYAAEQSMLMEINAARQVYGLETQQRVLESSNRMAGINKDLEISQAIVSGVADVGMAGFSVMK